MKVNFGLFQNQHLYQNPFSLLTHQYGLSARAPITYDFAVENECNIMSWPLTRPMSEAELYKSRLDEAMGKFPNKPKPIFAMMRHTAVYEDKNDWEVPVKALTRVLGQFENLFKKPR